MKRRDFLKISIVTGLALTSKKLPAKPRLTKKETNFENVVLSINGKEITSFHEEDMIIARKPHKKDKAMIARIKAALATSL